jgi:hypothetical protein
MTQHRTHLYAAALLVALALAPVNAHAGSAPKMTTTIRAALTGSFFLNTGDNSTSEWIDFSGDVQLVVQAIPPTPITPPSPIRVHANMAGVSGIGRTSGQHFVLNGSENFEADGDVPNTLSFAGEYRLGPSPPPISQIPQGPPIVPISFTVQVDENAIATSALATVGECTTDLECGN